MTERDEVRRELDRVVDRLNTMPLTKAEQASSDCHTVAQFIVARTPGIPSDALLPSVGVSALGAQVAVVGQDFLAAPTQATNDHLAAVLDALVTLRRTLP